MTRGLCCHDVRKDLEPVSFTLLDLSRCPGQSVLGGMAKQAFLAVRLEAIGGSLGWGLTG